MVASLQQQPRDSFIQGCVTLFYWCRLIFFAADSHIFILDSSEKNGRHRLVCSSVDCCHLQWTAATEAAAASMVTHPLRGYFTLAAVIFWPLHRAEYILGNAESGFIIMNPLSAFCLFTRADASKIRPRLSQFLHPLLFSPAMHAQLVRSYNYYYLCGRQFRTTRPVRIS